MVHYLTKSEYARLKGVSHQAICERVKRGTLKTAKVKIEVERIPVEDAELRKVKE